MRLVLAEEEHARERRDAERRDARTKEQASAHVDDAVAIGFEAYAIGGLSVGEPIDVMYDIVSRTAAA
jgi:queuine/archaeosine tRNA-ribosyltransferase